MLARHLGRSVRQHALLRTVPAATPRVLRPAPQVGLGAVLLRAAAALLPSCLFAPVPSPRLLPPLAHGCRAAVDQRTAPPPPAPAACQHGWPPPGRGSPGRTWRLLSSGLSRTLPPPMLIPAPLFLSSSKHPKHRRQGIMFTPQQEAWVVERFGRFHAVLEPVSAAVSNRCCTTLPQPTPPQPPPPLPTLLRTRA